jgi:alkylation response protein AidB-like acyl-CoA dehydrogenase
MEEGSMSDLEKFRSETRGWLEANCPVEMREPVLTESEFFWGGRNKTYQSAAQRVWFERMRDKKWIVPYWPAEYGGGGLDPERAKIVREEMHAIGARAPIRSFGIMMLGPALLKFGTEEQKREHIPKILSGDIRWCQGYSEPNAGSDLASLQTRADLDGDFYVVSGSKIWTSHADKADLDILPRANGFCGEEARGYQFSAIRHDDTWRFDKAYPANFGVLALLRNVLRRGARAEAEYCRRRQQGLGYRQIRASV